MTKFRVLWIAALTIAAALMAAIACGGETQTVEVIKEVPVEKVVTETVEVIKEVPVEKTVTKTVEVVKEVPVEKVVTETVTETVEVIKEVPVEKVVTETVVKEVQVMVEVTPVPQPEAPTSMGPPIYQMGIFEEPITRNFWNY